MWIGANKGLLRFDGVSFTPFDSRNTPVMKSDTNCVFFVSHDGVLWSGTIGGGLLTYEAGKFTALTESDGRLVTLFSTIGLGLGAGQGAWRVGGCDVDASYAASPASTSEGPAPP